ncbi:MAG: hypothetical protein J7521_20815 [Caulobacter sp.]|nr:hypothetical protein [Caulobacter sp.]
MTADELDKMIDQYADEGGPGLIRLKDTTWCALPFNLGAVCTAVGRGIRYRGVRIQVSRQFEDQVLSRAEALALGFDAFEDLAPPPERS